VEEERTIADIPIKHRYGIFPATIIGDSRLKAGQLRCLMSILAWRSNRTTNTRPIHLEALQLMMPMYTKGSIQNYMQDLRAFGYIEITPRPGTTSMYTICDKADAHVQYEKNRGEQVESSAADQLASSVASVKNINNKKNSRFMAVWSTYPEHRRNSIARDSKTWREFGDEALVDIIIEDLEARKETEAWTGEEGKWVPGLRKYLENRTWETNPLKSKDDFWKKL
tara:strand:+ start:6 stop:680 length:675 start_codon:yes stop_codon:yes gene_type:complete